MKLKNLNKLYIIKDKYMIAGIEYYILDFPMKAPRAYWTRTIWPEIIYSCKIISSGTSAVIVQKRNLEAFDDIVGRHAKMFYLPNRKMKAVKMSQQLGLLEKQKGYYPENL